jgi:Ca2+-binding RTX toxin-like protein
MKRRTVVGSVIGVGLLTGLGLTAGSAKSAVGLFANTSAITINDAPGDGAAAATPYPSQIVVSGLSGVVTDVNVTINGLTHTFPEDIGILLVGPTDKTTKLMSDVGCGVDVTALDLTFDDAATLSLPNNNVAPRNDPFPASGSSVKPTSGSTGSCFARPVPPDFPSPAPAGPYGATLGTFNGTTPNGVWKLFVIDDTSSATGSIGGGWSLQLTTAPSVSITATIAGVEEGGAGEFTLSRTGDTADPLTVNLADASINATSGGDYDALPVTATFPAGKSETALPLTSINDSEDEGPETVDLTVLPASAGEYAVGAPATASVTIAGNDHATTTSDMGASPNPSVVGQAVTLQASVTRDTASGTPTGSVTFAESGPGSSTCTGTLNGSGIASCSITFTSPGTHNFTATYGGSPADVGSNTTTTVQVNLPTVTIEASDANASETAADKGTFTITRNGPTGAELTVSLTAATGTAMVPGDYAALPASVKILSGSSTATIDVAPANDTTWELDETVRLAIASGTGYIIGTPSQATVTIADDDPAPTTTVLTSNRNPSTAGQPVTLTAKVTSPGGTPTGTVTFVDEGFILCENVPLGAGGVATCDVDRFVPDVHLHQLIAVYAGNADFLTSTSIQLAQTMEPRRTCHGVPATIVGTKGADRLVGTTGRDVIVGLGGDDDIQGLGGNDLICGGAGNDDIRGGNGADRIDGDSGADTVLGEEGDDDLFGDNGNDRVSGGNGNDRVRGGAGTDVLDGGDGTDTTHGTPGPDTETAIERRD